MNRFRSMAAISAGAASLLLAGPLAVSAGQLRGAAGLQQEQDQVTSISQFSDVRPTDWAYQALSNLIERYGCVAGYPNGSFKGGQPISRYEAAALLNACLDRISETTDELKRLLKEFEQELAILKGRVDGLEARVGVLEATQFSTTTKLRGETRMVLGGLSYSGNTLDDPRYTSLPNALTFNYDVRLNFDTSFTGKDLLRTQLRAGNFAHSGFGAEPTPLTELAAGFQEACETNSSGAVNAGLSCGDEVSINRLFYQVPISSALQVVVGPRVRQDELLPVWPSVYTAERILQIFQFAGAPGAYNLTLGSGAGLWWRQAGRSTGWSFGAAYVAAQGDNGNPSQGGIATDASAGVGTLQLAYTGRNWNITGAFSRSGPNVTSMGTPLWMDVQPTRGVDNGYTQSFALSGYWQPFKAGWLPSISAGWGLNRGFYVGSHTQVPQDQLGYKVSSESWSVGLVWADAFAKGNALGVAFGQPMNTTNTDGDTPCHSWFPPNACSGSTRLNPAANYHDPNDENFALEVYYKWQVSDNIALTPALFWFSRPQGQYTLNYGPGTDNSGTLSTLGALLQTTFRF